MTIVDLDKLTADVMPGWHFDCLQGVVTFRALDSGDWSISFEALSELSAALQTNDIVIEHEVGTDWGGDTGKDFVCSDIGAVPEWKNQNWGQSGRLRMVGGKIVDVK